MFDKSMLFYYLFKVNYSLPFAFRGDEPLDLRAL